MYSSKQQKQKPKQQETHRCKYCGKEYPAREMGQIGLDVWICRGCA